MARQYYLLLDGQRTRKLRKGKSYIVGRSENLADIKLKHDSISRQHAKLIVGQNSVTIQELGSVNGTLVDEKPLKQNQFVILRPGMTLKFGELEQIASLEFEEVETDASQSPSRSRSKSKEVVKQEKKAEGKKQKLWSMGNLKSDDKERLKRLMGAKDESDGEEEQNKASENTAGFERMNKQLEQQFKVALNRKHKGQAGLGM